MATTTYDNDDDDGGFAAEKKIYEGDVVLATHVKFIGLVNVSCNDVFTFPRISSGMCLDRDGFGKG